MACRSRARSRRTGPVEDRDLEIEFLDDDAEVFSFRGRSSHEKLVWRHETETARRRMKTAWSSCARERFTYSSGSSR